MATMNTARANVTGHLVRKPETRVFDNGGSVTNFSLAVNRRWQDQNSSEWKEAVSYFNFVARNELGEKLAETLNQGDYVSVTEAEIRQRTWQTDEGNRSTVEFLVTPFSAVGKVISVRKADTKPAAGGISEDAVAAAVAKALEGLLPGLTKSEQATQAAKDAAHDAEIANADEGQEPF